MIAGLGAQFLGMARAAIAVAIEILRDKVSVDPGTSIRERPSVLADIASYSTAVTAARSHLHASMDAMWDKVRMSFRLPRTVRHYTVPAYMAPRSRVQRRGHARRRRDDSTVCRLSTGTKHPRSANDGQAYCGATTLVGGLGESASRA